MSPATIAVRLGSIRLLESRIEKTLADTAARGGPPLRVRLWNGRVFDLAANPVVTVTLRDSDAASALLGADLCTLAEAIIEGRLEVEGSIHDIIRVGEELARASCATRRARPKFLRHARHTKEADAEAIRHHYDVSNDFYALWLDREMVYSCAYFRSGDEDVDTAQRQKVDHICRKLRLAPGERLLDIGCGWGALVRHAAREYGVEARGITLSPSQYEYAKARIEAEALAGRCRVLLEDYRDHAGEDVYDKIVSIGMFEHVGIKNPPVYFGAVARLLRTGGFFLNHGITATDVEGRDAGLGGEAFIDRYIFPGGERRYLTWLLYLAGCAHAFTRNWVSIHQILALKPDAGGAATMPWTREYQYARLGIGESP